MSKTEYVIVNVDSEFWTGRRFSTDYVNAKVFVSETLAHKRCLRD